MKVDLYNKTGVKQTAKTTLAADVFAVEVRPETLQLAYNAYLANGRSAGAKTLTRGLVRGGGKKPWRQKGTGRARAGSSRIPHWRGGGVVFGPTGNENHTIQLNTKLKRAAIRQALSSQAADGKLAVLEAFEVKNGTVKEALAILDKVGAAGRVVLVVADKTELIDRATRNIPWLETVQAQYLNVFTVLNADMIVLTDDASKAVSAWLAPRKADVAPAPAKKAAPKAAAKPAAKPAAKKEKAS